VALARSDYTPSVANDRGATNALYTTGSFTFPANSLVCIEVHGIAENDANVRPSGFTLTKSAGAGALSDVVQTGNPAQWGYGVRVWKFETGASSVTCTFSAQYDTAQNRQLNTIAIIPHSWTGYDTTTPIGGTATGTDTNGTGAATITLSAAPASSDEVVGVCSGVVNSGAIAGTGMAGSGWTQSKFSNDDGWGYVQDQTRTGSTSTSVAWADVDGGNTAPLEAMLCAYTVKAAAGGGGNSYSTAQDEATTPAAGHSVSGGIQVATTAETLTGTAAQTNTLTGSVAQAEALTAAAAHAVPPPFSITAVWSGNSVGSGWVTESGSLTYTASGGETLLVWFDGFSNLDQGQMSDSVHGTITRITAAFNASIGSGGTYGGWCAIANVSAGSHTITPTTVVGGDDGIIRAFLISGLPTTLTVKTAGKSRQATSSQSYTLATSGAVNAGDLAFAGRCNENSVVQNPVTITMPSGWTRDFTDFTNGGTNLPTNVCHIVVSADASNLSATWTCNDAHITDTSGAIVVFTPTSPAGGNTYSPAQAESLTASTGHVTNFVAPAATTEALTATAAGTGVAVRPAAQAEALTASDSPAGVSSVPVALAEALAGTDTPAASLAAPVAALEAVTASDSQNTGGAGTVAQAETGSTVDTQSAGLQGVVDVVDQLTASAATAATGQFPVAALEATSALESLGTTAVQAVAAADALSATEAQVLGSIAVVVCAESLTAQDAADALRGIGAALAEVLAAADSSAAVAQYVVTCLEAGALGDLTTLGGIFGAMVEEALVLQVGQDVDSALTVAVDESVVAMDLGTLIGITFTLARLFKFASDSRTYTFPADVRTYRFPADVRSYRFPADPRTYRFPGEDS
jgi:hypothetical protein